MRKWSIKGDGFVVNVVEDVSNKTVSRMARSQAEQVVAAHNAAIDMQQDRMDGIDMSAKSKRRISVAG